MRMQLTMTGGCLGDKPEPVEAAQHPITHATFVKMHKSARWLQYVVTANKNHKTLKPSALLETILQKIHRPSDHGDGPLEEDDAMQALDYDADANSPPDANASRAPDRRIPLNAIVDLAMPTLCPSARAHPDPDMRTIKVWYRGR